MRKIVKDLAASRLAAGGAALRPQSDSAPEPAAAPGPVVILVEPQLGANIGAAARAMANFALSELRLVRPRDGWPNEAARANASGAHGVIDGARVFASTAEAVGDLHFVCATTARPRDMVKPVLSLAVAAEALAQRTRRGERCGVLFGPERSGLDNDDVALADAIVTVPVNPDFASLNLAQAVLLLGYECLMHRGGGALGRRTAFDAPAEAGLSLHHTRPATRQELIGLFEHLERELDASGFLRPPEKRPAMVRNIRNMLLRLGATDQDVRTLRGIISSLARAHERRRPRS